MTLKQYLITMSIATSIGVLSWFFVMYNVDPFRSGAAAFFFFYVSFFFSVVGLFSLVLFFLHRKVARLPLPMFRHVQRAFRESIFIATFITLSLYLQGQKWLNVWNAILLVLLFILYASFNLSVKKERTYNQPEDHQPL